MYALKCALCTQCSLDLKLGLLLRIHTAAGYGCRREEGRGYMVVTVHTDNFLCDIGIGFHIFTVRRNLNGQFITVNYRLEIQRL